MRRIGGLLLVVVALAPAGEARAQGLLPNPYGFGGGFQFSYSRGGNGRGLRIGSGVNFGAPLYAVTPLVPLYPPIIHRVTLVNVVPPQPAPRVVFVPVPGAANPLPPAELPRFLDPPVARPPAPKKDDVKPAKPPAELPQPPAPRPDPVAEHDRQLRRGREAFQAREYGRAAQRFRQATNLRPEDGQAYFLLAQARIAQGKYHEAEDALVAGLEHQPDWPTSGFRPVEMYEAAAENAAHLRALEETVARHPRDPTALFVCGYVLWFDGRRDEAVRLFRRALERAKDPEPIECFLKAAVLK